MTLSINQIWPEKASRFSAITLRRLDADAFLELKRNIYKRAIASGFTQRSASRIVRAIELKRRINKRRHFTREALIASFQNHPILDSLVKNRRKLWRKIRDRRRGGTIKCRSFSFIDDPVGTLRSLAEIARADCEDYRYRIDFEDEFVLDIAPFLVLGSMREKMAPMVAGGHLWGPTRKVIEAAGLRQFLRMKPFGQIDQERVWPLPLMRRSMAGVPSGVSYEATQATSVEIRADQIALRVGGWLDQLNPPSQLTDHGAGRLKLIVTEILNNAERHSREGGGGDWVVAGFMARRDAEDEDGAECEVHVCHLTFLNLGRSIAETIMDAPTAIRDQVARYCKEHRGSGLSASALATVFALQDGISRVEQGKGQPSGGTGMMDAVEFANEVGREPLIGYGPQVAILSGDAYIRFAAPYVEGFARSAEDERRLQWFNPQNDVHVPPDVNHVKSLPVAFPGTLITMRFAIDESLQTGEQNDG